MLQLFDWSPPTAFHFDVKFLFEFGLVSASFSEVDGLSQELVVEDLKRQGDTILHTPKEVKYSDIVLKRAMEPLCEPLNLWVKMCFDFPNTCRITPCDLIISLLDEKRFPVAVWSCRRAIPVKWNLSTLSADKSEIAIETLTLKHSYLERDW